ncbi:unnamed protein product [Urochloa humidicola]
MWETSVSARMRAALAAVELDEGLVVAEAVEAGCGPGSLGTAGGQNPRCQPGNPDGEREEQE